MTTISTTAATAATTTTATTAKTQTLGQSDFLNLLVAQMKNQDPLNPADPTQFTSQLAQFSQLEQLTNLNTAMGNLTSAQNNSDKLSSISLIGQDVMVEDSNFNLGTSPVQIGYTTDGTATTINLQIKDSTGKNVATLSANDLSSGSHFLTWNGQDSSGNMLASGTYTIALDAKNTSGTAATVSSLVRSQVTGIDLSGREAKIVTGGGEYNVSAIQGAYNKDQNAFDSSTN